MGEIVNLRRVRKGKAKAEQKEQADANRIAFGRSKVERTQTGAETARAESRLDGHRLVPDESSTRER